MLTMPSTQHLDGNVPATSANRRVAAHVPETIHSDWRQALPLLAAEGVTLRELRTSDAPTLLAMLTTEEVARFISPPPTTVEGFEKFIAWTRREQAAGRYVCFGIVPAGRTDAVGLVQVRALDTGFAIAELGFAIGSEFWGTGLFQTAAAQVLEFAFTTLPVNRIEARVVVENGRGNGALNKLGASSEARLRQAFKKDGTWVDQMLWSIVRSDWIFLNAQPDGRIH
jgi:ribosomal-protein-alanine N-acetyltransferase